MTPEVARPSATHTGTSDADAGSDGPPVPRHPGPEGPSPVPVHLYMDPEMTAAAKSVLPPIRQGGRRFGQELEAFCRCWRPTGGELCRILKIVLGPRNYEEVRGVAERDGHLELRALGSAWDDAGRWERYTRDVCVALGDRFPVQVDMSRLHDCRQGPDEPVGDFLRRLDAVCQAHGGVVKPADAAAETPYEVIMRPFFYLGLRQPIQQRMSRTLLGGWAANRLADCVHHAKHAEAEENAENQGRAAAAERALAALTAAMSALHWSRGGAPDFRGRREAAPALRPLPAPFVPVDGARFNCGQSGHWDRPQPPRRRRRGRGRGRFHQGNGGGDGPDDSLSTG